MEQPKLRLARVPNNKIVDFRSSFKEENLEGYWGLGDPQQFNEDQSLMDFLTGGGLLTAQQLATQGRQMIGGTVEGIEEAETLAHDLPAAVGPGNLFLSPFQKEKRTFLLKGATVSKNGDLVGSSNDSEFSKLYITRDIDNNARGMFFYKYTKIYLKIIQIFILHLIIV